jgi:putative ABC transport system permease protein
VVIGFDVADALFPGESPLGKDIRIRGPESTTCRRGRAAGEFSGLFSWDSMVAMPLTTLRRYFLVRTIREIRVQVDLGAHGRGAGRIARLDAAHPATEPGKAG